MEEKYNSKSSYVSRHYDSVNHFYDKNYNKLSMVQNLSLLTRLGGNIKLLHPHYNPKSVTSHYFLLRLICAFTVIARLSLLPSTVIYYWFRIESPKES